MGIEAPKINVCLKVRPMAVKRVALPVRSIDSLNGEPNMLRWSVTFLIIALIAGALGLFRTEVIASQVAWPLAVSMLRL